MTSATLNVPIEFSNRREVRRPTETLIDLITALRYHTWAHRTTNYRDYVNAVRQEDLLFARAMQLAVPGLDAFRQAREDAVLEVVNVVVSQVELELTARYQTRINELRAKYMSELDVYQEELSQADWYFDSADDLLMYQRGATEQHKLVLKAHNRPEAERFLWINVFKAAYANAHGNEANWEKLVALAKASNY